MHFDKFVVVKTCSIITFIGFGITKNLYNSSKIKLNLMGVHSKFYVGDICILKERKNHLILRISLLDYEIE